jgi:lipid-binding SYLF domain-containing protein
MCYEYAMKRILMLSVLCCVAFGVEAADKAKLDQRARHLIQRFEAMQAKTDKAVPADILKKAQGVILLERTKAGFIFAYQGGSGIAISRDPKSGDWSPIAFLKANEASLGFQIGGQQSFLVILLMTKDGTRLLTDPTFEVGGEARGTAGDSSAGAESTISSTERPVLVFDERQGLFGGAAIKGGAIAADEEANRDYYSDFVTLKEILFENKVKPTKTAQDLAEKLQSFSKKQAK